MKSSDNTTISNMKKIIIIKCIQKTLWKDVNSYIKHDNVDLAFKIVSFDQYTKLWNLLVFI